MRTWIFFLLLSPLITNCLDGKFLMHMEGCKKGQIKQGNQCVYEQAAVKAAGECVDPDLSKLLVGVKTTLCDGTMGTGTLKLTSELPICSKDGEQDCVAKAKFKALDTSKLTADKIVLGQTVVGITGTSRKAKQCRNASNLSYFDSTPQGATVRIPGYINTAAANTITMSWSHGLSTNDPVQIICSGGTGTTLAGGGVVVGTTYYVGSPGASTLQLKDSPVGTARTITGTGGCSSSNWVLIPAGDGIANNEDTIDDLNGFAASTSAPSSSPWGADYLCNESNFVNVSGAAPLAPSNTTPTNASQSWSQIWEDQANGLYVTNILYHGTPNNRDWFQLNAMCKSLDSLNGGSGGTGWRLPTQKELMQLYIDGISKVSLAGGTTNDYFWSSSGVSSYLNFVWNVDFSNGNSDNIDRVVTGLSALCVR